jgi:lipopolysaccharide/colanic/teichoic acid biosynthesis glycosyltransferase
MNRHSLNTMPNLLTGSPSIHQAGRIRNGRLRFLARIRWQLVGAVLIALFLPLVLRQQTNLLTRPLGSSESALAGTAFALLLGAYGLRKMAVYPGVQAVSFVLPTFAATYGLVVAAFFFFRIDYSRFQFVTSFALAVIWFMFVVSVERRYKRPFLVLLPFGHAPSLLTITRADWGVAESPAHIPMESSGVVADLRADLDPEWERFLATCALKGLPVYHSKQVSESLTGRVEIEHISENSLGSLLPSSVYLRFKRLVDIVGVLIFLPAALLIGAVAAFAIWREDGQPVFFRQKRMGYRGEVFEILKFRTMRVDISGKEFTEGDDPRITRIGRFLRRSRIDELPQIVNIIRGEMSWIGPRPESLPLSEWYESKIPFYSYRHIVRPGITGWAQVQQGYAARVAAVTDKLTYDFFYIKNFSPWLDLLIVARTIRTVLTGFGAR